MSMESAKSFIEKIKNDEDFKNKVTKYKDNEARTAFIKQAGYDFTGEDMELAKAELSEEDLNGVSGAGAMCFSIFPW